jgi:hypothetical protein
MQADFSANATTYRISGAFIAAQVPLFGFVHLNGYHLLFVIFGISFVAQINVLFEYRWACTNKNFDFFEQRCPVRWLEYAFTSPAMITVIASCLTIRDMHTLLLFSAVQGALVQFGFPMECAYLLRVHEELDDDDDEQKNDDDDEEKDSEENPIAAVAFRPLPLLPYPRTLPKISQLFWYWSCAPSTLLHVLVWGILLSSFQDQMNTRCSETQPATPPWIVGLVGSQFVLFSFFMVVAVVQTFWFDMIPFRSKKPVSDELVRATIRVAFLVYTILSAAAKSILGMTYLAYVLQFPFYTPA